MNEGHDSEGALVAYVLGMRDPEPAVADLAVLRSLVALATQDDLADALERFIDSAALLDAVVEQYRVEPNGLGDRALAALVTDLILGGPIYDPEPFAEMYRRRHPSLREAQRLWAMSADDPDLALARFKVGAQTTSDRVGLVADARDYFQRMNRPELADELK